MTESSAQPAYSACLVLAILRLWCSKPKVGTAPSTASTRTPRIPFSAIIPATARKAMFSAINDRQRTLILACIAVLGAAGGWLIYRHAAEPPRPHYVLINETGQHDFDRAFT